GWAWGVTAVVPIRRVDYPSVTLVGSQSLRRDEVLRILAENRDEIARFGVTSLAIFGSVARDEAGPDSDVDILVEFGVPVGYFRFFDLRERLEQLLGCRVDLATPDALHQKLRDRILREAISAA
ncbi:MAG TPA: nucleotidyltransferase family protein, partial [Chloroflexota bacterium]